MKWSYANKQEKQSFWIVLILALLVVLLMLPMDRLLSWLGVPDDKVSETTNIVGKVIVVSFLVIGGVMLSVFSGGLPLIIGGVVLVGSLLYVVYDWFQDSGESIMGTLKSWFN